MSWTTPRTWITSEVVSAAQMNTHVRDNFLATTPAVVAAAGDTVYATGANALARLPVGSTGQVLKVAAGLPSWGAAVSKAEVSQADAVAYAVPSSWGDVTSLTMSYTSHGGILLIGLLSIEAGTTYGGVQVNGSSSATNPSLTMYLRPVVNGVTLNEWRWSETLLVSSATTIYLSIPVPGFFWMTTPAAFTAQTIKMQAQMAGNGTPVFNLYNSRLVVLEI